MARLKKDWFFDSPPTETGEKFNKKNIPTSQTYRELLNSIPFVAEVNDTAKTTEQGLVKLYSYSQFIDFQAHIDLESKSSVPPPNADQYSRAVQASQIPAMETYQGYEILAATGWEHEAKEGGIHFKTIVKQDTEHNNVRYNMQLSLSFDHLDPIVMSTDKAMRFVLHKEDEVGPGSLKVLSLEDLFTEIDENGNTVYWKETGGVLVPIESSQNVGGIGNLTIAGTFSLPTNNTGTVERVMVKSGSNILKDISFEDFKALLPSSSPGTELWEIDGDQLQPTTNGITMKEIGSINFHATNINIAMQRGSLAFPNDLTFYGSSGDGGGKVRLYGGMSNSSAKGGDMIIEGGRNTNGTNHGDVVIKGGGAFGDAEKGDVILGTPEGHKVDLKGRTKLFGANAIITQPLFVVVADSNAELDVISFAEFKAFILDSGGGLPNGGGTETESEEVVVVD